jgi:hypothetical protein
MDCWHKTLDGMNLSEEAQSIRRGIVEFLQELASVDRRWIRIDSRSNNTFDQPTTDGKTNAVDFPVESFSDLLGISANKANELETIENEIFDFQETVLPYARTRKGIKPLRSFGRIKTEENTRCAITLITISFKVTKCGPKRILEGTSIPDSTLES